MSKPRKCEKCEAKEFDKWDKANKDREIPKPTLAESPHLNKICPPKWEIEALLEPEIKITSRGKIKEFINKYFNQNNYGTKFPIYFCILDLELRNSPEGEEDFIEYYSPIHGESISKEIYLKLTEEEREYGEYFPIYQALYPVEKGVFLLEEEARQHLEANHYHYHENAKVYCKHMWRAPETEKFLNDLKEFFNDK